MLTDRPDDLSSMPSADDAADLSARGGQIALAQRIGDDGDVIVEAALRQADQIFALGEQLPSLVRDAVSAPQLRLAVGISDGLPKLVVRHLLQPVIAEPHLRLLCHEGEFDELLGDLALHRLDVVLSDRPAPTNPNIKLYSHTMGSSTIA